MKFLMLRGQVPQDRDPQEIVFDRLEDVDDVWAQLLFAMLGDDDYGEVWYWGGKREKKFAYNFIERWMYSFNDFDIHKINPCNPRFIPDVIFCRGGFKEYHPVLERFPEAIKIYYGAGNRYLPQPGFHKYDIILQDSWPQVHACKAHYYVLEKDPLVTLFIKPAADNIFYPMPGIEKEYDVCFPANGTQPFKGHEFVYSTVPEDIKLLNLGNPSKYKYPNNVTSYRVLRPNMAREIAKCKVGVVAVSDKEDSCPRVIPELLACNVPIVVLDGVRFQVNKSTKYNTPGYIQPGNTGYVADKTRFWLMVKELLFNYDHGFCQPRKYYEENLSLNHAAKFLRRKIDYATKKRI